MSDDQTPRFALPLLAAGQAQKEVTHNEALALIDLLIDPVVEAVNLTVPPSDAAPGQCWAIGAGAVDAWAGHDGQLVARTEGGWRFVTASSGAAVRVRATGAVWRRASDRWTSPPIVVAPTGGATVDTEARVAVAQLLAAVRGAGLVAL